MNQIKKSELILNADNSIYHLKIKTEDLAELVILVGDQDRVPVVSSFFDSVEIKKQNREFVTHTGFYNSKKITVLSTGIGTDNIDIVVNELDALVNIDFEKRCPKKEHKSLSFVRIGTAGSLQTDVPVDIPVASAIGCGFDGLLNYYKKRDEVCNLELEKKFISDVNFDKRFATPYFVSCSQELLNRIAFDMKCGITVSAPGFYGPQGRELRLQLSDENLNQKISAFNFNGQKILNFEMECSAIYGLSALLGHKALTVCNIVANRTTGDFSKDYKPHLLNTIKIVLDRLTGS